MANIHVLPIHLVNKIAAGELVERPASVLKELVENALDAGASRIDIAVEDGGKKLIRVSDNGSGMDADDLALAFAPHATSKIATDEDLFAIVTMGFRGEALASVAAISHAEIRTARPGDDGGWEIRASGESVEPIRPCAAASGTTATVRDLFFNTPGRRKFLRTANTEFGHVSDQFARLVLAHPQVAFSLTHNGREVKALPQAGTTRQRIVDLFGQDFADSLLPLAEREGRTSVAGFISTPAAARASTKWQFFFLNGRFIRDRLLAHALREGYRGLIDPSRSPAVMIFLDVDPAEVDVNVHPTKIEVRFRDSQRLHGDVLAALKETLNKADLTPDLTLGEKETATVDSTMGQQRRDSLRQALADFFKSAPPPQPRLAFGDSPAKSAPQRAKPPTSGENAPGSRPATPGGAEEAGGPPTPQTVSPEVPSLPLQDRIEGRPQEATGSALQIHNSYIVAAAADGLIIIDQHALHERLIYNDLRRRVTEGKLGGQRLLIPPTLRVSAAELNLLTRHADLLRRLGLEVAQFGPQTVAIQQYPSLLAERGPEPAPFLRELLDRLGEDETTDSERLMADVLEMMACKAAVKAGDPLTGEEIAALLDRRDEAEKSSACPHGRPTTVKVSLRDLEKQFKRT